MAAKLILEGLGLGFLLCIICFFGIRRGAVGMVHLYSEAVQKRVVELGLSSPEKIRRRGAAVRGLCLSLYLVYVLVCVYGINGARGFFQGFWQMFVILQILNLVDRLLVDECWVGRTKAWDIPGTEDLKPYITAEDKKKKWLMETIAMAAASAVLAGIMTWVMR